MNRLLGIFALGALLLCSAPSQAQQANNYWCNSATVPCPPSGWTPASAAAPLPVTASVSASISGFPTIQSTGTPISVTTGGVTGTLPTGTVVVASNVGATNGAYCKLGASATTSDQLIPPNSWFAFTVGANTQLTCITSTSTTTVNMVGGSGLPTGSGGGGGGSGGGGAITAASGSYASGALSSGSIASGAFASGAVSSGAYAAGALAAGAFASGAGVDGWDLTQGTKADAAWASGSGSVISLLKAIATTEVVTNRAVNLAQVNGVALGSPSAYGTSPGAVNVPGVNAFVTNTNANGQATAANSSPVVLPAAQVTADPCTLGTKTNFTIATSSGTVQLVAPSGSTQVYICSLFTIGATASIQNIVGGTGATCTTGTPVAIAGSTTAASGMSFAANGGFTFGNGGGTVLRTTTAGHGVCLIQSATAAIAGGGTYVQQ